MILDAEFKLEYPELEAEIYYLTEKEGGRAERFHTGYRGQFFYDGRDWDATQQFLNKEWCELGDTVIVLLQTLSPLFHFGKFYIGKEFVIREGDKIVGRGKITKIFRQNFIKQS